ncbi:hypothetical protein ACROYT_G017768 [Oculina patagonica]
MVFTAYIFQEDFDRLTKRELSHASQSQKGGSLFGQWTSTGNPVVHFAMSFSASKFNRDQMGKDLYDAFKICYIGEWRPVHSHGGNDSHEMNARGNLWGPGAPARFLVLDVSRASIVPFLFDRQTPKGTGNLERLPGENPFNKRDVFRPSQSTVNYNNPQRYGQQSGAVVHRQVAGPSRAPQYQEAVTTKPQWYASDEGSKKLQKVHDDFKKIARGGHVEMSRDSRSQDISMSFTDIHNQREWEVKFPPSFPYGGAVLIEKPGPRTSSPAEYKQGPSEKASTAVTKMIATIKSRTALY